MGRRLDTAILAAMEPGISTVVGGDSTAGHAGLAVVSRALLVDGVTPLGAYAQLRALAKTTFLFESVVGGERWARWSFVGIGYRARIVGRWDGEGIVVDVEPGPGFAAPHGIPPRSRGLDVLYALLRRYEATPQRDLPPFWGGLVGVFGHELVRALERLPRPAHHESGGREPELPAFELIVSDTVLAFDGLSGRVTVIATYVPEEDGASEDAARPRALAEARIDRVVEALAAGTTLAAARAPVVHEPTLTLAPAWSSTLPYTELVARAREHIHAGDVFQLVLSQRFVAPRAGLDALAIYRALRTTNPAPYMLHMELPSATIVGASPEVLVRVERDTRRVVVRPIAGTRPRGRDAAEDDALEADLLADPKERAEHLMLVDLGRNDVGRIAKPGTVSVDESFVVERYSRVMHIVSEVSGELRDDLGTHAGLDALFATFPAGTLSGAPKVRALQLIDELEPAARGWFGGAVGYLGFDGGADFCIAIRCVVAHASELWMQAGAGLVWDSDPRSEDEECRRKASAVAIAIDLARGLASSGSGATHEANAPGRLDSKPGAGATPDDETARSHAERTP